MSPDFTETINYILAGGYAVIAAALVSLLGEKSVRFQLWPYWSKVAFQFGVSAAIGIAAWAAVTYVPPDTLRAVAPLWQIVFFSALPVLSNQLWHKLTK